MVEGVAVEVQEPGAGGESAMTRERSQAPVKTNPYDKGKRRRPPSFRLWPEKCWQEMREQATGDWPAVVRRWNLALYGRP